MRQITWAARHPDGRYEKGNGTTGELRLAFLFRDVRTAAKFGTPVRVRICTDYPGAAEPDRPARIWREIV